MARKRQLTKEDRQTIIYLYITKTLILYICIYVCMYVCSQNTSKMVHESTKLFGPPYSTFACGVQYQVSLKLGNKKIIQKSIPDSVKYSSGEFDQCKQPQRYSSLELSSFFLLKWFILKSQTFSIDKERFIFKHKINIAISI